jgi:hypothetical protein
LASDERLYSKLSFIIGGNNIHRIKDKGLRDWLFNYDNNQKWLHDLHLEQRDQETYLWEQY